MPVVVIVSSAIAILPVAGERAAYRVSTAGRRSRRPDPCAAGAFPNGLEGARAIFDGRALIVSTGRRIGADDEEGVVRRQALLAGPGGQDGHVAGFAHRIVRA